MIPFAFIVRRKGIQHRASVIAEHAMVKTLTDVRQRTLKKELKYLGFAASRRSDHCKVASCGITRKPQTSPEYL